MSDTSLAVKRKSQEIVNRLLYKKRSDDTSETGNTDAEEERVMLINWCKKHKVSNAAAKELLNLSNAISNKVEKDSPYAEEFAYEAKDPLLCGVAPMTADETTLVAITSSVMQSLEPLFVKLTEQIEALREDIQTLSAENDLLRAHATNDLIVPSRRTLFPKEPFKTLDEFIEFDQMLEADYANYAAFEYELSAISEAKNSKFVRVCWRRLMEDPLAEKFSWRGTESKKNVSSLTITTAIRNVFVKDKGGADKDFVEATKAFFQFAKNRQKQRQLYIRKYESV